MKRKAYYEALMSLLALLAVSILIIEYTMNLNDKILLYFSKIDFLILIIFTVDYGVRFFQSNEKRVFFKNNLLELIAIIPFSSVFRIARMGRLTRVLRLSKLTRLTRSLVFFNKFKIQIFYFFKLNGLNYAIGITALVTLISAVLIMYLENFSFFDSLWWAFVTITTVGYGDLSPQSGLGRLLACVLMLVGIGFLGMLTGTIATYFIKPVKKTAKQETVELIQRMLGSDDLSEEDIDHLCVLVHSLKSDLKSEDS